MFNDFKKYNKWKDYINIHEFEVKLALLSTAIFFIVLFNINLYGDFEQFAGAVINMISYLIAGFFTLIGFSVSGIAIIVSLFSKKDIDTINKYNNQQYMEKVICSFEFISFNLSCELFMCTLLYFYLHSKLSLLPQIPFWILTCILIYLTIFNVFYIVSLIANCIKLYKIKQLYTDINREEKRFYDVANEVRIDFIISTLTRLYDISPKQFMDDLENTVNQYDFEDRERMIQYFREYYDIEK
nr:MAG TPA: hypothetical protein [Caudoviricetes sp.]